MFSVVFPGQGSQSVGMGSELHKNYGYIQDLFSNADDILGFNLSKLILEGPKENLDLTEFTQPAIFLVSFSIFEVIKKETEFDLLVLDIMMHGKSGLEFISENKNNLNVKIILPVSYKHMKLQTKRIV